MALWRAWSTVVTAASGESPPWTQNIWLSMHAAKLQPAQSTRQGIPIMTILASQVVWQAKCLLLVSTGHAHATSALTQEMLYVILS